MSVAAMAVDNERSNTVVKNSPVKDVSEFPRTFEVSLNVIHRFHDIASKT